MPLWPPRAGGVGRGARDLIGHEHRELLDQFAKLFMPRPLVPEDGHLVQDQRMVEDVDLAPGHRPTSYRISPRSRASLSPRSIAAIFWTRCSCRPPSKGGSSQVRTTSRA